MTINQIDLKSKYKNVIEILYGKWVAIFVVKQFTRVHLKLDELLYTEKHFLNIDENKIFYVNKLLIPFAHKWKKTTSIYNDK